MWCLAGFVIVCSWQLPLLLLFEILQSEIKSFRVEMSSLSQNKSLPFIEYIYTHIHVFRHVNIYIFNKLLYVCLRYFFSPQLNHRSQKIGYSHLSIGEGCFPLSDRQVCNEIVAYCNSFSLTIPLCSSSLPSVLETWLLKFKDSVLPTSTWL